MEHHPEVQKFLKSIQSKGGKITLERYGREHYQKMRQKSRGRSKPVDKTADK